ncbi:hypothetical protein [Rhizobium aegyptiacum]|uniref:hypothetical protein n=1 Tax=Rhizobium aegyptiacum TaxID=1764550 RepID=UPI000AB4B689|nr:hypothetical protein [Rhizobium aegyptiacum]
MVQILLNSAVAVLVGSAVLTSTISALLGDDRSLQRVPVKIRVPRGRNDGGRFRLSK